MGRDESLNALRDDRVSQRLAQTSLETAKDYWLAGAIAPVKADLALFDSGVAFDECLALKRLLRSKDAANDALAALFDAIGLSLNKNPLGQVPFRHQYQHGIGLLQLVVAGDAALSLVLYEQQNQPPPQSVCFTDTDCHELVLAGTGTAQVLELESRCDCPADINSSAVQLLPGECLSIVGANKAKQMQSVRGSMVLLRLSRTPSSRQESREYRLADGKLLHRASGDPSESRKEMIAALLGAMERKDAARALAELTRHGSDQLRWQALRNCLALDSGKGFQALSILANMSRDSLAGPAGALRTQLLATYPELSKVEVELCPA